VTLAAHAAAQAAAQASGAVSGAPPAPSDAEVRRAAASVFADRAYDRSLRQTLWDRFLAWLADIFRSLRDAAGNGPGWRWAAIAALVVLAVAIAARVIVLARAPDAATARGGGASRRGRGRGDAWAEAERLSSAGDYTGAAHALYQALLGALARRERLRLHESKTVGDYGRELRARSSPLAGRYREFARTYEVVVYGEGHCDRERWERLRALAAPMVGANAEAAA